MLKKNSSLISIAIILGFLAFIFVTMMPFSIENESESPTEFSTKRAFKQVEAIAQKPHFVGSQNHEVVALHLQNELKRLRLQTSVQEGYTLSNSLGSRGVLVYSKNILARIKGNASNTKAILLLSHYDSAPHSYSKGASDDGSGVATILESVRAFLKKNKTHKNDIIILFSDGEELGLSGAELFVQKHPWAKEVGLVLNFEARGSSGPSYMLMETNNGNSNLVKSFAAAGVTFPVSNSLMYSIYKMLPNDTDLTVFRAQGNIEGYNFAFIDDHYNYHTAQDDAAHLEKTTLAHQGSYLMPLLQYFSNANLNPTKNSADFVYFTAFNTFISYPFDWVFAMSLIALGFLVVLVFLGLAKRILFFKDMAKGSIPFLLSLLTAGGITFFGWKGLLFIYPQYNDLLNGFTYNGHDYIAAFVLLSVSICFAMYQWFSIKKLTMNHYVFPLFFWIAINIVIANALPGAGFLIIPVFFGIISFGSFIFTQKSKWILNLICAIPTLLIIAPLIQMFPIGLGLKILFGSAILTTLAFVLLLPVFGAFTRKGLFSITFLVAAIFFFVKAQMESGYTSGQAKSNSLTFVYNADTNKSYWITSDVNLDSWTKTYLGENPQKASENILGPLKSKYNSNITFSKETSKKAIVPPTIQFLKDSLVGSKRFLKIKITPNRAVNRYDIFADEKMDIFHFKANGIAPTGHKNVILERFDKQLIRYYVVGNTPLIMEFDINNANDLNMELIESSFDLMSNPLFNIQKRESWMMPTPFILNDAVIVKQKIKRSKVIPVIIDTSPALIANDSLEKKLNKK